MGAGSPRTRLQAFAARTLTRFVGRQAEVEALRQAHALAGAGHGQLVAVMGEPGVGRPASFTSSSAPRGPRVAPARKPRGPL